MNEKRIPPGIWKWLPTEERKRGGPKMTMRRTVQQDILNSNNAGINLEESEDRTRW